MTLLDWIEIIVGIIKIIVCLVLCVLLITDLIKRG